MTGWLHLVFLLTMDDEQFCALMDEIKQSREEVKELKQEVNTIHKRTTRELSQKISKLSYQFKKKVHEIQFNFNSKIEELITLVKNELKKVKATNEPDKEVVKKAEILLDEGLKTLVKHQKHIKVANSLEFGCLELGWYFRTHSSF